MAALLYLGAAEERAVFTAERKYIYVGMMRFNWCIMIQWNYIC